MHWSIALLPSLLILTEGSPLFEPPVYHSHVPRESIQWTECGLSSTDPSNNTFPILCGSLPVPLDYSEPKCQQTINLPLLKLGGSNSTTKKGSILLNFGGPGINGTTAFETIGAKLKGVVGPDFDLITWHPRGTSGDLLFSCYQNATARAAAQSVNPTVFGNASDVADGQLWANGQILGDTCAEVQKNNGSLIGTAYTARDAMRIVDALSEDGLIRYWGFSYGTVLGSTIAAMFPDRVDRLIIDGVVNVRDYYHGLVLSSRESSDDVVKGFAEGCIEKPDLCPLAQNRTADQVYNWIFQLMDDVKAEPAVFKNPVESGGDFALSYTSLKALVYEFSYSPEAWPVLSNLLYAVETRNTTTISGFITASLAAPPEADGEALAGIQCSDTFARVNTLQEALSYVEPFRTSRLGGDVDDPGAMNCARWPFAAKERYSGNFQVNTKNPLLVLSNTWDPATPLASGKNVSSGFEGSVLLEQRGYGHCSTAQASLCTMKRVRDYFHDGTLPTVGTVCKVDEPLFPADSGDSTWAYVLKQLAQGSDSGTTITG